MKSITKDVTVTLKNSRTVSVKVKVTLDKGNIHLVDFDPPVRCVKGRMLSYNDQNETTKLVEEEIETINWWRK